LFAEIAGDERVASAFALDLVWTERYDDARRALEETLRAGRATGNRMQVIWNQNCLAQLELRLGRLQQARLAATESIAVGETHAATVWVAGAKGALAGVQAWQGDEDACRRAAAEAVAAAQTVAAGLVELGARAALGLLAVGLGRAEDAIDELAPAARRWWQSSFREPGAVAFVPDLVEAYAHAGEPDQARLWLARFRETAERAERLWALAAAARCEGILAEPDAFDAPFARSLALLDGSPLALERARTQLVYGERLRRAGRRREARRQLRAAHAAFAAVDAAPWAERAAAELRATGESVGPRTVDREAQLTPQELQIAKLVAEGRTNKAIAAQLYLSPKTIEYHLANAYRKLDVHSRVELTRLLAAPLDPA
jgi:DNA-binding CsgD family transcriptional regulator